MTYLQMDGVDDRLHLDFFDYDEVEIDIEIDPLFYPNASPSALWYMQGFMVLLKVNDTNFTVSNSGLSIMSDTTNIGARGIIKWSTGTVNLGGRDFCQSQYGGYVNLKSKFYSIKLYKANTLVAFYDMGTGTIVDQTGNGNLIMLVGGTWVDDTPSIVTYKYVTKQKVYENISGKIITKQMIFSEMKINLITIQKIIADKKYSCLTSQKIFSNFNNKYLMKQIVFAFRRDSFALLQRVSKDVNIKISTKQEMFRLINEQLTIVNKVYKNVNIKNETKQIVFSEVNLYFMAAQLIYEDKVFVFSTLQKVLKGWQNYRKLVEYIFEITPEYNIDMEINEEEDIDLEI